MHRRVMQAIFFGFVHFLVLAAVAVAGDGIAWIGREFNPKPTCRPKIGTKDVPLDQLPRPFCVQKVQGDWLWMGKAWVKKADVVAVGGVIEEFEVLRNGEPMLLPVTIRGRRYSFVLDTGCVFCAVDSTLRPLLRASAVRHPVDRQRLLDFRNLDDAYLGATRVPVQSDAMCLDLPAPVAGLSGQRIHGILGMTFLQRHVVKIDFTAGRIAFMKSVPASERWDFTIKYTPSTDEATRPVWELDIGAGRRLPFLIDTGMATHHAIDLESKVFEELVEQNRISHLYVGSSRSIFGLEPGRRGTMDSLGPTFWKKTPVLVGEGEQNLLGLGFLRGLVMVFDFPKKEIYVRILQSDIDISGAEVVRNGRETIVQRVAFDSQAWWWGLREGDRLLSIDGENCGAIGLLELQKRLSQRGRKMQLVVENDAESRKLNVLIPDRGEFVTEFRATIQERRLETGRKLGFKPSLPVEESQDEASGIQPAGAPSCPVK